MTAYIIRRLLWMIPLLWAVITITFVLMHNVEGGPFERERELPPATIAALNQKYVEEAPLVIVCCADANRSRKAARQTNWEDLRKAGAVDDISDELVNQIERGMNPEAPETDPNIWLPSARANVSIAITHMMLMATALGLGTVWLGATGGDVTRKLLSIPDDVYLVALLCVGYPDQSPPQRPRLSRDEILLPEPIPAKAAALA